MKKKYSYFRKAEEDEKTLRQWVNNLEEVNGYEYEKISIRTSLGKTQVYAFNSDREDMDTLVIFPGFRTTSLIWDLDKGLFSLSQNLRIFLVEINGQPNLSEGNSPDIKSLDYGKWGAEVFDQLKIESAFIAGASFGGLVCMKISLVIPNKIKSSFLLNPGCFRMISFGFKNMYYNLLPILNPTSENILKFLNQVVFCKPEHKLSKKGEDLLIEYLYLAIARYKDNTEKPYYMKGQLNNISVSTYLIVGANDILIPPNKTISNAKKHLNDSLKEIKIFKNVGHGIECYKPAIEYIGEIIKVVNNM